MEKHEYVDEGQGIMGYKTKKTRDICVLCKKPIEVDEDYNVFFGKYFHEKCYTMSLEEVTKILKEKK